MFKKENYIEIHNFCKLKLSGDQGRGLDSKHHSTLSSIDERSIHMEGLHVNCAQGRYVKIVCFFFFF